MAINPFDILKNAQKIQEQMGEFQNRLGGIAVTGSSGGGMVKIGLNGRMEVLSVHIEREAMENRDMLEDLVSAALADALDRAKAAASQEMGSLAGGFGLPGLAGGIPGFGSGSQ